MKRLDACLCIWTSLGSYLTHCTEKKTLPLYPYCGSTNRCSSVVQLTPVQYSEDYIKYQSLITSCTKHNHTVTTITRKPCCRKETARCRSCSFTTIKRPARRQSTSAEQISKKETVPKRHVNGHSQQYFVQQTGQTRACRYCNINAICAKREYPQNAGLLGTRYGTVVRF